MMRKLRAVTFLAAICAAGSGLAQGVYVAGQGFTLEQAVEQALSERVGDKPFWIVASAAEAQRVVRGGDPVLERIRAHGGIAYVCESDLRPEVKANLKQLPPVVGLVRPPDREMAVIKPPSDVAADDAMPESDREARLILRACAALQ